MGPRNPRALRPPPELVSRCLGQYHGSGQRLVRVAAKAWCAPESQVKGFEAPLERGVLLDDGRWLPWRSVVS